MTYDLIVVGGGVSGMVAAICSARHGKKVLILEKGERVGRKLLATGNGKCNLGNVAPVCGKYNSDFPLTVLGKYDFEEQVKFWRSLGLVVKVTNGRAYPYGEQASMVLNALRKELERLNVTVFTETGAEKIEGSFKVNGKYEGRNLLLATGSPASFGFDSCSLISAYGHESSAFIPALVPLITDKTNLKGLKGIRADVCVKLMNHGKTLGEATEEIIFKDNGVSGTAIFTLSQILARERKVDSYELHIDFAPDYDKEKLKKLFSEGVAPEGMFHKELAQAIRRVAESEKRSVIDVIKDYELTGVRSGAVTLAQVMCGGLKTSEFDGETLESKRIKGLFAAGEALDVDGECGGFNLMWAIASGMVVGEVCGSR